MPVTATTLTSQFHLSAKQVLLGHRRTCVRVGRVYAAQGWHRVVIVG